MATNAEMLIQRIMSNDGRSYEQLGLEASNASRITVKEVEKAYRSIARFVHPDNCGLAQAKEAFQKLNEAYRKIVDFKTKPVPPQGASGSTADGQLPAAPAAGRAAAAAAAGRAAAAAAAEGAGAEGGRAGEPRVQDGLVVGFREREAAARAQEAGAPAGAGARARREEGARAEGAAPKAAAPAPKPKAPRRRRPPAAAAEPPSEDRQLYDKIEAEFRTTKKSVKFEPRPGWHVRVYNIEKGRRDLEVITPDEEKLKSLAQVRRNLGFEGAAGLGAAGAARPAAAGGAGRPAPPTPADLLPDGLWQTPPEELVGKRIRVWWKDNKPPKWFDGTVTSFDDDPDNPGGGEHNVEYDDGDTQYEDLTEIEWRTLVGPKESPTEVPHAPAAAAAAAPAPAPAPAAAPAPAPAPAAPAPAAPPAKKKAAAASKKAAAPPSRQQPAREPAPPPPAAPAAAPKPAKKKASRYGASEHPPRPEDQPAAAPGGEVVGTRIRLWWAGDRKWFDGTVTHLGKADDEIEVKNDDDICTHTVHYDDGNVTGEDLGNEQWRRLDGDGNELPHPPPPADDYASADDDEQPAAAAARRRPAGARRVGAARRADGGGGVADGGAAAGAVGGRCGGGGAVGPRLRSGQLRERDGRGGRRQRRRCRRRRSARQRRRQRRRRR